MKKFNRKSVIESIEKLPEEFELNDLLDRLLVYDKIEKGLKDCEEGRTYSNEEMKEMIKSWQL